MVESQKKGKPEKVEGQVRAPLPLSRELEAGVAFEVLP
jgi:hypothetical protein